GSVVSHASYAPTYPETSTSVDSHTVPPPRALNQQTLLSHTPNRITRTQNDHLCHCCRFTRLTYHSPVDSAPAVQLIRRLTQRISFLRMFIRTRKSASKASNY